MGSHPCANYGRKDGARRLDSRVSAPAGRHACLENCCARRRRRLDEESVGEARILCDKLRAMRATLRGLGDFAQALGAGFRRRRRRRRGRGSFDASQESIERQDDGEVNYAGHNQERNGGVDEVANVDGRAVDLDDHAAEVGLAHHGSDELGEDVFHHGVDDGIESRADDDGDGQVDNVSTQNKVAKSLEHLILRSPQPAMCTQAEARVWLVHHRTWRGRGYGRGVVVQFGFPQGSAAAPLVRSLPHEESREEEDHPEAETSEKESPARGREPSRCAGR